MEVSQNTRKAIAAVDALERLYTGLVNNEDDRRSTNDLIQDLRDAIEEVKEILGRISEGTEGTIRSELEDEHGAKSSAQQERFANGPSCD